MKFWELAKIANRNLLRSKLRTFLTVMAIFVGSFTLTLTNGLGDGLRDYVENQVKNVEGKNILFIRKKFAEEDSKPKANEPAEYKETTQDEAGNTIDPNSYLVSLGQAENLVKEFADVKTVTPRYWIEGEYITLDGTMIANFKQCPANQYWLARRFISCAKIRQIRNETKLYLNSRRLSF